MKMTFNIMKTRICSLFPWVLATALGACGDDVEGAMGGESPAENAFLVATRIRTPADRTVLLTTARELELGRLDASEALELPGTSRAVVFDERVYAFDGERGAVIRFEVSPELRLQETGRFSMAGLGIVSFRSSIVFLDPRRAYYVDISGQQVVVFDPEAMEVVTTFAAPELAREGFDAVGGTPQQVGDQVVMPLSFTNLLTLDAVPSVAAFVVSATEDRVIGLFEDDRCALSGGALVDDGSAFLVGDNLNGALDVFGTDDVPAPCLLRYDPNQSAFDGDFLLDLRETLGVPHVADLVGRGDGTFVTRVFASDFDPASLDDPRAYFDLEVWGFAVGELSGASAALVDALPLSGISFGPFVVDDSYLLPVVDEEAGETSLYRLEGTTPEALFTASGEVQYVARIR